MLVAGVGMDALINTLLFLAGVIPGHIHGFYVTWTYFSRKRKVKKGRYPGGPKPLLYSKRVINGDASDERVRQLWRADQRAKEEKLLRKGSSATRRSTGLFGGNFGGGGGGSSPTSGSGVGNGGGGKRRATRDSMRYEYSPGSRSPRY